MAKVAGILGKKVGMTQLFDDKGDVHPATVLQAGPCVITQHKTETRDGYPAAQIGLVEFVKESRLTQPMKGHLGKHNLPPVKFVREVPIEIDEKAQSDGAIKAGDRVLVDIFEGERFVDIVGVRKEDNLLVVEGSVPGPNGGYLVITKAKKPPRERRGFAGLMTVDPLKAAKRAAKKA